jgi:RNA polymerase sigma-70 factor (ECF subfamily)
VDEEMQAAKDQEQPDEDDTAVVVTGNIPAFPTLYERYFDGIYDFAIRTVGRSDVAAEIVQKTFTKARLSMQKARSGPNVKAKLYTIARKSAIDELRSRSACFQWRAA